MAPTKESKSFSSKAMAQVASLIANDHEDEATRLFRHGWMLYQQVQQAPPGTPAQPCCKLLNCTLNCHP